MGDSTFLPPSLQFLLPPLWKEWGVPGPVPGGQLRVLKGCWDLNWRLSRTKPPCHLCEPVSAFRGSEGRGDLGHLTHSRPWPAALRKGALASPARERREGRPAVVWHRVYC